jgi:Alr-MurF fusion protein
MSGLFYEYRVLKINITLSELSQVIQGVILGSEIDASIHSVVYDSRLIKEGDNKVFFALNGRFRKGIDFFDDAYDKGIRVFVVDREGFTIKTDAVYIHVKDALEALLDLAKWHRKKFSIPIIVIAGTHGKTIVKEWLGFLLNEKFRLVKSPKSYNSKLGVALSLLELHNDAQLGVFEVSLTDPGEGKFFNELLKPSYGIITHVGDKFNHHFDSKEDKVEEYATLFNGAEYVFFTSETLQSIKLPQQFIIQTSDYSNELELLGFKQSVQKTNAALCLGVASFFEISPTSLQSFFPDLAMRLESYEGIDDSIIVNDTYGLDLESLETSLQYQESIAQKKKKIILLPKGGLINKNEALHLLKQYQIEDYYFIESLEDISFSLKGAVILVKGGKNSFMNKIAGQLKLKRHRTKIEIDLSAIRKNIHLIKDKMSTDAKCLIMVKANAYGAGLVRIGQYIEQLGADYLGVAYTDEGVALRTNGVKCPILVMNAGVDDFQECIDYHLEPSIYSLNILDEFIKILISNEEKGFPIHLKIDTGMKRLGIDSSELEHFISVLNSQPEISLKGVYSHFAESNNVKNPEFTKGQLASFLKTCSILSERISDSFIRHISNSDATLNYPESQLDMVRLGLVTYGISENSNLNKELTPVITWSSQVAQIKLVRKGESIGYGRSFRSEKEMQIAIIPVGYADGFRRSLGNGKGSVFINGHMFYTIGNVCMDMIMIDVSNEDILPGAIVEIIGENQSLRQFAKLLNTIPYEVLTSLSNRVHRNYIIN